MFDNDIQKNLLIHVEGIVQGVGFRPFVYRLAHELHLTGWVNNSPQGVDIELAGQNIDMDTFVKRLWVEKPSHATITKVQQRWVPRLEYDDFTIRHSDNLGDKSAPILPDLAICPDCLQDILDPNNRRYRYPFTNCTHCGPRYSIIHALPYDRIRTTMWHFKMCNTCLAEYQNPLDRRFHAQPNACPDCGPQIALWDCEGNTIALEDDAILFAVDAIKQGQIVAFKGLGGFQLLVDARKKYAIQRLRELKHRPDKPFALMFPTLDMVQACCDVSPLESAVLQSSASPIVLLQHSDPSLIADNVAPKNPYLGVMLPYTPLHVLLMRELNFPIVATSGNLSDEPICIDEYEALEHLSAIADVFLVHNRPIERPVDDSIVQIVNGELQILRRARGYAPLSLDLSQPLPTTLAVGGHLKNTIAITHNDQLFLSQHIGDLENAKTNEVFQLTIADFKRLYDLTPQQIVYDLHPDYLSTHYAQNSGLASYGVQHHVAHVLAGILDNQLDDTVLGVVWDGTGYGTDHMIWGGEWFIVNDSIVERVAHLRPFALPGGDVAIREPRRSAIGVLYNIYGDDLFDDVYVPSLRTFTRGERLVLQTMLDKGINAPLTTSMGRLFDAVASILNLCQTSTFEGQAAMAVEYEAMKSDSTERYTFELEDSVIDWRPVFQHIMRDVTGDVSVATIARKFHNALADMIVQVAQNVGEENVLLTGGCFQNRLLTQLAIGQLRQAEFTPYWHQRIPPNDGGIAVGQILAVAKQIDLKERIACV